MDILGIMRHQKCAVNMVADLNHLNSVERLPGYIIYLVFFYHVALSVCFFADSGGTQPVISVGFLFIFPSAAPPGKIIPKVAQVSSCRERAGGV